MLLDFFISIEPYSWKSVGTAILCGAIIGLERQLRGKPVGIRTSTLIILGTYIFLQSTILETQAPADVARVIGQIITGIGFLGAGVMLAREGSVVGVTSAASIWIQAAIGIVIALGNHAAALKFALLTVVLLYGLDLLETHTKTFNRGVYRRYTARKNKK